MGHRPTGSTRFEVAVDCRDTGTARQPVRISEGGRKVQDQDQAFGQALVKEPIGDATGSRSHVNSVSAASRDDGDRCRQSLCGWRSARRLVTGARLNTGPGRTAVTHSQTGMPCRQKEDEREKSGVVPQDKGGSDCA